MNDPKATCQGSIQTLTDAVTKNKRKKVILFLTRLYDEFCDPVANSEMQGMDYL